jgi:hypothetical protein
MKNESMGLTDMAVTALRSCVLHADGLARRIHDFFPVTRNQKPLVDLSKVITCENIDEMLIFAPGVAASHFWKTADLQVEQLPLKIGSPFGDW